MELNEIINRLEEIDKQIAKRVKTETMEETNNNLYRLLSFRDEIEEIYEFKFIPYIKIFTKDSIKDFYDKYEKISNQLDREIYLQRDSITALLIEENKKTQQELRTSQSRQFASFSVLLTALSLMIYNSVLFKEANLSGILIANVSFLLSVLILFTLVYFFLIVPHDEDTNKKFFTCMIIITILLVLIIIVYFILRIKGIL